MHNLSTVVYFEVVRTLKKKSFWIMAFGFPLMIAAVFGIIFFSNKTTDDAMQQTRHQKFSIGVTDESKLIQPSLIAELSAQTIPHKQDGIEAVRAGKLDAYFFYPANIVKQKVEVYGQNVGIFDNGRYQAVAESLLQGSVAPTVSDQTRNVLQNKVAFSSTTYESGKDYNPMEQMILPGIFLILFYLLISFFGNQMLTSTTEEKENRVIEMLLTTVEAKTLIIGKILSLIVLGFIQIALILTPIVIAYLLFHDKLSMPALNLSELPVDPLRILLGLIIFVASYAMFTGLLVTIGAATPTAKEAGGFFGLVMMLIFGPLYAASLFVSSPHSTLVTVLTFFPFTAPIPLMLRNAIGNLTIGEATVAIIILTVTAAILMHIAVRVFRFGALEYHRKLGLREIVSRK